jgi:WD40 repeat protein
MVFSLDRWILATAGGDKTVLLWDLTDRDRPRRLGQPLTGHTDEVNTVAFSPDGHTLATVSENAAIILWDMKPLEELRRDAVREACTRAGGPLDEATWGFYAPGTSYQNPCAPR